MSTPTKKLDPHRRAGRVAARIREELAVLLGREIDDPHLVPVVVGEARGTDDLSQARIWFAVLGGEPKGIRRKQAGRGLKALVPALRAKLAWRLEMRRGRWCWRPCGRWCGGSCRRGERGLCDATATHREHHGLGGGKMGRVAHQGVVGDPTQRRGQLQDAAVQRGVRSA